MGYILKGWVTFEYEGQGTYTFREGDSVLQPPKISHREIEHSEDLEILELQAQQILIPKRRSLPFTTG